MINTSKTVLKVFMFFISLNTYAQIVTTCSTDSIRLTIDNHNIGTLEWEKSTDAISWEKIKNQHNESYTFKTDKAAYYRAVNKFSNCDPSYSSITLVQRPPVAITGQDRLINNNSLFLAANTAIGSTGTWSVINGAGGTFDNVNDPLTRFTGTAGTYTLQWQLENSCGVSADTIDVTILENNYNQNIVIVDDTDSLLSSTAQLENGEYIIEFNEPVPIINTETILIGTSDEGYLRKVNAVSQNTNTFTLTTEQGRLEDVFVEGGFELGNIFEIDSVLTNARTSNYKKLNHKPTRAEILSSPELRRGVHFFIENENVQSLNNNVVLSRSTNDQSPPVFNFSMSNTLFEQNGVKVDLNGSLAFTPNIFADYKKGTLFRNRRFALCLNNATLVNDFSLNLTANFGAEIPERPFNLFSYTKTVFFLIGGVPLSVDVKIDFDGKTSAEAFANLDFTHQYTNTITTNAGVIYEDETWSNYYSSSTVNTLNTNFNIEGGLVQYLEIGPKLTFKVYGIIGPYVDFKLTEDFDLCASSENLGPFNWQGNLDIGAKVTAGVRADILQKELFDFGKTWKKEKIYSQVFPHSIEVISGNHQEYSTSSPLIDPVKVRVISSKGNAVPGVAVSFKTDTDTPGIVTNQSVMTDINGYAETDWIPESSGVARLIVSVKDCDDNNIIDSPLVIQATEVQGIDCSETTLNASNIIENNVLKPIAHLGLPPYTYSTDNVTFTLEVPEIIPLNGQNYSFYIKDSNGCLAVTSYYSAPFSCNDTNLDVEINMYGSNIVAEGFGGQPPYQYALDGDTNFSNSNTFYNVETGEHYITIKDANNCTQVNTIDITNSADGLLAYFVINNSNNLLVNFPVRFTNLSNSAISYSWDFGNGNSSTLPNPANTYTNTGQYTITLTVIDELGNSSSYERTITLDSVADCIFDGDVFLQTQEEINAFGASNYCGIKGNLTIGRFFGVTTPTDIYDLSPLISLNTFGGGILAIRSNPNLATLSPGLENLVIPEINSDGFGTSIQISHNDNLTSLEGLGNIEVFSISLLDNNSLLSLNGLQNIKFRALDINTCASFNSFSGINNSIDSLRNLEINNNDNLSNLNGLENVIVTEFLSVFGNDSLINFCGLNNQSANANTVEISNNAYNPTQQDIIEGNCEFLNTFEGNIQLFTQEEVNTFAANNYTVINGNLTIGDLTNDYVTDITDISNLSSITSVNGNLGIGASPLLNLNGLENVSDIGGNLRFYGNTNLTDMTGLTSLTEIGGDFDIAFNFSQTTMIGLSNLNSVYGNINFSANQSLSSLEGLSSLNHVGGELMIRNNNSIISLNGLANVTTINQDLIIRGNQALNSLQNLEGITSINGTLHIQDNDVLSSLDGLDNLNNIRGNIYIGTHFQYSNWPNPNLSDLCALTNLLNTGGLNGSYNVANNSFNPTQQDIIDGNCSQ